MIDFLLYFPLVLVSLIGIFFIGLLYIQGCALIIFAIYKTIKSIYETGLEYIRTYNR
jgi:hypothetical protein